MTKHVVFYRVSLKGDGRRFPCWLILFFFCLITIKLHNINLFLFIFY